MALTGLFQWLIFREPRWGRVSEGSGEDPFFRKPNCKSNGRRISGDDLSKQHHLVV
jgi:hypothetical protein